jgi:hypothetical protein
MNQIKTSQSKETTQMAAKRPATISIKNLSAAVEKAAKHASEKNQAQFGAGIHIGPIITGKVARPQDFAQAEKLASDLTAHVAGTEGALAAAQGSLEPAVLLRGGVIICGFIAPEVEFVE